MRTEEDWNVDECFSNVKSGVFENHIHVKLWVFRKQNRRGLSCSQRRKVEVFEVSSKVRKMEEDVSGNQCYYKLIDLQFYNFSTRNHIQGFTDKSRVLFAGDWLLVGLVPCLLACDLKR